MPRRNNATENPVLRDSHAGLWAAVRDGIVDSSDITTSGHLRTSLDIALPAPSPTNWAYSIHASSPFGKQTPPFKSMPSSPGVVTPKGSKPSSPVAPPAPVANRVPLARIGDLNKRELDFEDGPSFAAKGAVHEALLRRFVALAKEVEKVL